MSKAKCLILRGRSGTKGAGKRAARRAGYAAKRQGVSAIRRREERERPVVDAAQLDSAESLWLQQLHCDDHQHLVRTVLAPAALVLWHGRVSVADGQVGLVDFDHALLAAPGPAAPSRGGSSAASSRPFHSHPDSAPAADPSAVAMLLVRQVPRTGQPHPQRRAGRVEDRARRHRALV